MRVQNRQDRVNLLLFALVLVLSSLVWLTLNREQPAGMEPLTRLDPARVERIIIHNDRAKFTLGREGGHWSMISPRKADANAARIRSLLKILNFPSLEQFPVPSQGLAAFGLERPRASIQFDDTRIWLGGIHPYNNNRYLRIGDTIHLIKDIFPHHFLAGAEEFVATTEPEGR